mmetsp:Transcript_35701/g.74972  ORF Transcript_35701/g.74972 Transcript_35701/m.74972 type:complete len:183 (-) Transcript_35701:706-1254(-)
MVELGFGSCCRPLPGDKIAGVLYKSPEGERLVVHRSFCEVLAKPQLEGQGSPSSSTSDVPASQLVFATSTPEKHRGNIATPDSPCEVQHSKVVVNWGESWQQWRTSYMTEVEVEFADKLSLPEVSEVTANQGSQIRRFALLRGQGSTSVKVAVQLEVRDLLHLERILAGISALASVHSAVRR